LVAVGRCVGNVKMKRIAGWGKGVEALFRNMAMAEGGHT
jgi:hypothetical protein